MTTFDDIEFSRRKNAFLCEYKKVENYFSRRPLTKSIKKRLTYKQNLTEYYNNIVLYLLPFSEVSVSNREICIEAIEPIFSKLKQCFSALLLTYNFSENPLILQTDTTGVQGDTDSEFEEDLGEQ